MKKDKKIAQDDENKTEEEVLDLKTDEEKQNQEEKNEDFKDNYLRALAELENTKKRCATEIEKNSKYAIASFAKDLLVVADNLNRAISAVKPEEEQNCAAVLEGVKLTEHELSKVFKKHGVEKMDILNTVFDPNFHQVVQEIPDETKPAGTVIAEIQTGYTINDRILREAMVVVTKNKA